MEAQFLCTTLKFCADCVHIHYHPNLSSLPVNTHPIVIILQQLHIQGIPVSTAAAISLADVHPAKQYACHGSSSRDTNFVRGEHAAQMDMGPTTVFPWTAVHPLPGLWIILVGLNQEKECLPCLTWNYMWRGMNVTVICEAPPEDMQLVCSLPHLIRHIL